MQNLKINTPIDWKVGKATVQVRTVKGDMGRWFSALSWEDATGGGYEGGSSPLSMSNKYLFFTSEEDAIYYELKAAWYRIRDSKMTAKIIDYLPQKYVERILEESKNSTHKPGAKQPVIKAQLSLF